MGANAKDFDRIARALAEPRRIDILRVISERPGITCKEVVCAVGVAQSTVAQHVRQLVEADLVTSRKEGHRVRLDPNPGTLRQFIASLNTLSDA